ncbi:MAG: putative DNA-binding domain-containing protein [Woeseia sp.]
MAEIPEFQRKQYAFAAHIRNPDLNPAPGRIEDRRMAIYRELFFNNLLNLLGSTFPVLKKLHEPKKWQGMVREFMSRHRAHTPYFLEIPREFLEFLDTEHPTADDDFPFLKELAHYEWMELALSVATESDDLSTVETQGDLLKGVPVRSALAWPLVYRYPVHRISPEFKPTAAGDQPTYLVIFRGADDEIGFMELNLVTAKLLDLIATNDDEASGRDLLLRLAEEINYPDADTLVRHGLQAMDDMRRSGILLGVRKLT